MQRYELVQQVEQLALPSMVGERYQVMLLMRDVDTKTVVGGALHGFDRSSRL